MDPNTSCEISILPVLQDNYIFVIQHHIDQTAIIIDPAEAKPILDLATKEHFSPTHILLTHHHADHIGGVAGICKAFPQIEVIGFQGDKHRLPPLTMPAIDQKTIHIGSLSFKIHHLPGHTTGHIAFHCEPLHAIFSGDVLFGMGCGRIFEGTFEQMFNSLQLFKNIPPQTKIYCTHEYTLTNGMFAIQKFPQNRQIEQRVEKVRTLRSNNRATVPLSVSEELTTNPFLMADTLEQFRDLRLARNDFKI